jgi:hypothetical protein
LFSFVHQSLDGSQKIEDVAFFIDPPSIGIEIVIDIDNISRREDASTLSSQIDPITPTVVRFLLDIDRISDVDVDFIRVSPSEFVQTTVSSFHIGEYR